MKPGTASWRTECVFFLGCFRVVSIESLLKLALIDYSSLKNSEGSKSLSIFLAKTLKCPWNLQLFRCLFGKSIIRAMNLKKQNRKHWSLQSCDPGTEKQHSETTRCRETGTFQGVEVLLSLKLTWNTGVGRCVSFLEDAYFFRAKLLFSGRVSIGKNGTGFLQAEEAKLERRELQEQETRHEARPSDTAWFRLWLFVWDFVHQHLFSVIRPTKQAETYERMGIGTMF